MRVFFKVKTVNKIGEIAQKQWQPLFFIFCIFPPLESSQKDPSATTEEEEEEEESCGVLEAQVLSLSEVVRENSAEFIKDVHGSHVVRTLLHVLAGCLGPPRTDSRPGTHTHTYAHKRKQNIACVLSLVPPVFFSSFLYFFFARSS